MGHAGRPCTPGEVAFEPGVGVGECRRTSGAVSRNRDVLAGDHRRADHRPDKSGVWRHQVAVQRLQWAGSLGDKSGEGGLLSRRCEENSVHYDSTDPVSGRRGRCNRVFQRSVSGAAPARSARSVPGHRRSGFRTARFGRLVIGAAPGAGIIQLARRPRSSRNAIGAGEREMGAERLGLRRPAGRHQGSIDGSGKLRQLRSPVQPNRPRAGGASLGNVPAPPIRDVGQCHRLQLPEPRLIAGWMRSSALTEDRSHQTG